LALLAWLCPAPLLLLLPLLLRLLLLIGLNHPGDVHMPEAALDWWLCQGGRLLPLHLAGGWLCGWPQGSLWADGDKTNLLLLVHA
jgi:hypothetical protein